MALFLEMEFDMKYIAVFGALVMTIVVVGLIMSLPVMWLWNVALVPAIPGILEITWLQAWGILILCGLLFKNSNISTKEN